MPQITLYFLNWDDSFYLPFIAKHYKKFCQRIVMYDNHSTDGSQELAKWLGFEVRTFGVDHLDDQQYMDVKNNCWKECREGALKTDYVIVCDADEFVFIDKLQGTAPVVVGFNMISDDLPVDDITEINTGAYSVNYSKQAIFDPCQIEEINYIHGAHRNRISGHITTIGHCRLHHFRQIGGLQRILDRHALYRTRMSAFNLKHGMGIHYLYTDQEKEKEWNQLQSEAVKLW